MPVNIVAQSPAACCPQGTAKTIAGDSTFSIISTVGTVGTVGTVFSPYVIDIHNHPPPAPPYCNPYNIFLKLSPMSPLSPNTIY